MKVELEIESLDEFVITALRNSYELVVLDDLKGQEELLISILDVLEYYTIHEEHMDWLSSLAV